MEFIPHRQGSWVANSPIRTLAVPKELPTPVLLQLVLFINTCWVAAFQLADKYFTLERAKHYHPELHVVMGCALSWEQVAAVHCQEVIDPNDKSDFSDNLRVKSAPLAQLRTLQLRAAK